MMNDASALLTAAGDALRAIGEPKLILGYFADDCRWSGGAFTVRIDSENGPDAHGCAETPVDAYNAALEMRREHDRRAVAQSMARAA